MALTKQHTINFHGQDVVFKDAYITVLSATVNRETVSATVEIRAKKGGDIVESQAHFFDHDLGGSNAIKQAYLHLKTLPEFEGAVDC